MSEGLRADNPWVKAFGENPKNRRQRTPQQQIMGWLHTLSDPFDVQLDPTVLTDEQAALVLEALDPVIANLRRFRSGVASRDGNTCHNCGGLFFPARADAKHCSAACRQKAHRTAKNPDPSAPTR